MARSWPNRFTNWIRPCSPANSIRRWLYQNHLFAVLPKDAGEFRAQFACVNLDGQGRLDQRQDRAFRTGAVLARRRRHVHSRRRRHAVAVKASITGYERLARARVLHGREAWAPMALVDGRLVLRDFEEMICLDVRANRS